MSGGAFNCVYYKIETGQEDILQELIYERRDDLTETETIAVGTVLRQLGEITKKVKALEWHFSADSSIDEDDLKWLRSRD